MEPAGSELPGRQANEVVARIFEGAGWRVKREPDNRSLRADLLVAKKNRVYVVEVKIASEGRPDRVIALLSQAIIQASAYARNVSGAKPLAVVWIRAAARSLIKKVDEFCLQFAPDVAVGVVSANGYQHFIGPDLDALNVRPSEIREYPSHQPQQAYNLFSDLNQWMLKVLLAPEVPERLMRAPRSQYRNISELAAAAGVSMMSAFRFVSALRQEGFLDESKIHLRLVRRPELFRRWQSAALRSSPEMRMCFLIPGARQNQLRKLLSDRQACLGMFAAAEALGLGHVSGVPPIIYVPKLSQSARQNWSEIVPASPGAEPHLIVKQALYPKSLFNGAVAHDGILVSDVIQIWLDVSSSPSRGEEQADLLRRKVLDRIIGVAG